MGMIHRFWWGAEKGKRKTHWVGWDIMVRPKGKCGMGFKDFQTFSQEDSDGGRRSPHRQGEGHHRGREKVTIEVGRRSHKVQEDC